MAGFFLCEFGEIMHYTKPPLNFRDQAKRVIGRGLIADIDELETFLSKVNYYRFTGYLYPFRDDGDSFKPGTTFDQVRSVYEFDTELRLLTFSSIEIIDVAILRTMLVEKFTMKYGSFCYSFENSFNRMSAFEHGRLLDEITANVDRSKEEFVSNYFSKYDEEKLLPFWMIAELSSFGLFSKIFQKVNNDVKVPIANHFNLHSRILASWLHTLTNVRNICAHHARLWNRVLPIRPEIPLQRYHWNFTPRGASQISGILWFWQLSNIYWIV